MLILFILALPTALYTHVVPPHFNSPHRTTHRIIVVLVFRSMNKYTRRRRSADYRTDLPVFRPSIADMVADARLAPSSVDIVLFVAIVVYCLWQLL